MRNLSKFLIFGTLSCLISLVGCFKSSGGLGRSGGNPFADADAAVSKNIENLMGLSVGMTKAQVFRIIVVGRPSFHP